MSATVTLKVVEGRLRGAEFVYRLPALCSVGRGSDCSLRLPDDDVHRTVSRHHCVLEIGPPEARVSDLGSLNGTYVNGEPVGQRDPVCGAGDPCVPAVADYRPSDGDELRVGGVVFRVSVRKNQDGGEREPYEPVWGGL